MKLARCLVAEGLGCVLLAATVVGSGIMAQRLSLGNDAVALLANTGATVAVLAVLIGVLAPISGAHLNPAVTTVLALRKQISASTAFAYVVVQCGGCVLGAMLAHAMFELPLIQASHHVRSGAAQGLSEAVATFGLLMVVLSPRAPSSAVWMAPAWIGAAYWFTASTSFANPAITIARSLTDTFSGIRPEDVGWFAIAQFAGALSAMVVTRFLFRESGARTVRQY